MGNGLKGGRKVVGGEKRARRETEQRKYEHVATRRKHFYKGCSESTFYVLPRCKKDRMNKLALALFCMCGIGGELSDPGIGSLAILANNAHATHAPGGESREFLENIAPRRVQCRTIALYLSSCLIGFSTVSTRHVGQPYILLLCWTRVTDWSCSCSLSFFFACEIELLSISYLSTVNTHLKAKMFHKSFIAPEITFGVDLKKNLLG